MEKLKPLPCPFCGHRAKHIQYQTGDMCWYVCCLNCPAEMWGCVGEDIWTETELLEAWNRRHL